MGFIIFLVAIAIFGTIGLVLWASSDLPIIQREIAMNTRKDGESGPTYSMVKVLSTLYKVLAVILWVVGFFSAISGLIGGASMMRGLF